MKTQTSNFKSASFLSCLLTAICICLPTLQSPAGACQTAKDDTAAEAELEKGPMQSITTALQPILKLKFSTKDKTIGLDRKSWGKGKSKDELIAELRAKYAARGMDKAMLDRIVGQMVDRQTHLNSPVAELFQKLRGPGGMRSSSSSSSGTALRLSSGSASIECSLSVDNNSFEMKVAELEGPMRSLNVQSAKTLRLFLTGDDSVALLQQSKSRVMGVLVQGEKVQSGSSVDYYTFGREHPELQAELAALFRHAGVDLPLGVNEPKVKKVAYRMLMSLYAGDESVLEEMLKGLDASEFEKREQASARVAAAFEKFEVAIKAKLQSDELSIEKRKRLEKIASENQSKRTKDTRAEDCVEANDLLESPLFLVGLLEDASADQKDIAVKQIEKVTGQKFGDDVAAWRKWIASNAQ